MTLHVVSVISNPARFHSRYRLAKQFIEEMRATKGVEFHLVEAAFGARDHELTPDLYLRTKSEVWVKESMINLGVRRLLPHDWKYMAWIDADVTFRDPCWALETVEVLQHLPVIQPWQQCLDLGFHGDVMQLHQGFGFMHQTGERKQENSNQPYRYAHSGYAWACTRAFWERVGGLMDFCPLGSADHHQAWAMIDKVDMSIHRHTAPSYWRRCHEWQSRAVSITHKEVGFANGRIEHHFHGAKANRKYRERWDILVQHHFDPDKHLIHDDQGLVQLVNNPGLEHAIRKYNVERAEDYRP